MKNNIRDASSSSISQVKSKIAEDLQVKTTNINILLNRVRISKKKDFQKRIIFLSLLFLAVGLVGILSFI
tara:strand:+ start:942 stop:1151 length:210 start_codon:yes stop_codon:yes gene_type:complete